MYALDLQGDSTTLRFPFAFSLSMSDMGIYDNYPLVQLSNRHQAGEIVSEVALFLLKQDGLGSTRSQAGRHR